MKLRISLLLLASAILLTPRPSVSENLVFLAPSTCAATSSSTELPLFSPAESESLSKGLPFPPRLKCGSCGACQGLYADDQCGVQGGQLKYCSDAGICSQDGLYWCVCSIYRQ
jgi:hypothetical protein